MTPGPAAGAGVAEVLDPALLGRIRDRAADYDARNAFCHEDVVELAAAGLLRGLVPVEHGGLGWDLPTAAAAQRLLAAHAPATALAVTMHQVWVAVARRMVAGGHAAFAQVFDEAAAGEIFAFGISEPGNDAVLFDSTTEVRTDAEGSASFTGLKIFTSLTPVWTRLGLLGRDVDGGETPLVVGFLPRSAGGWSPAGEWDALGMRASGSFATALDGATVPAERVVRRLPAGPNRDPLIFAIFSSFLGLLSAVYTGLGDRALQLGAEHAAARTALTTGRALSQDPDVRYRLAEAQLEQLALDAQLRGTLADLESGVDHGETWFPRLVSLRTRATRTARAAVDAALQVGGGGQYARTSELSRLHRDVLAGIHHPSDDSSAHRTLAAQLLGPLED